MERHGAGVAVVTAKKLVKFNADQIHLGVDGMFANTQMGGMDTGSEAVRPLALAFVRASRAGAQINAGAGSLEAELYAKERDALPIGPEWGTQIFEVPGTPYR